MNRIYLPLLLLAVLASTAHAYDLKINISNVKSTSGNIKVAVFPPNAGFPSQHQNTRATAILKIDKLKASHTFLNLPEDEYAIAVFHDVNGNDDLDTNAAGIPVEPFGFSNNPLLLGPPTFRKCKVRFDRDMTLNIELKKFF